MKAKHNKKRNTAFVYEALVREATVAILKEDVKRQNTAVKLLKKHFQEGSLLKRALDCYQSLYETRDSDKETSEKILREAKLAHRVLDPHGLFVSNSDLIDDINTELEPRVFNNFVPNYKTLASIAQIFSNKISPRDQVLLEGEVLGIMMSNEPASTLPAGIDNVVVKTFIEKFNVKYDTELLGEQKQLLSYYISSFTDNALALKVFLNEEIGRLKIELEAAKDLDEIKNDSEMVSKTDEVIETLHTFAQEAISEELLLTVLKTQSLVKEIHRDGCSS
tara:strand:+ start:3403 stop:4236 length:834 start_codon:yes stop_codon:yes gene_type:complete